MIYRPLYVDKLMAYVDTPFVKILTGVRCCGKSTILKMIMERLKTQRCIPEERIVSCRYDSMEYEDNYPKYVLTTDAFSGGNYEGIKSMHIADFLLSSEY